MKYLGLSSIIPLAITLGFLLLDLCGPYASHSLLDHLDSCLFWCVFPGLILTGSAGPCTAGNTERLCVSLVVSFVLYTLLIFFMIRIALSLKKTEKGS
jgi:uncharacterized membrane protein